MKDWIYTSEQAKAIKSGDIDSRNKFYFDNYERIKILAKSFLSRGRAFSRSILCDTPVAAVSSVVFTSVDTEVSFLQETKVDNEAKTNKLKKVFFMIFNCF